MRSLLPGLFCCTALAVAQGGDTGGLPRLQRDVRFESGEAESPGPSDGLARFCAAVASVAPARIAPATSGRLLVALSLRGRGVFPARGRLELHYDNVQGGITLGTWSITPPQPGKLSQAYLGQRVYEDTAIVEVPLAVGAGVPSGSHPILLRLDADVHDKDSGEALCSADMPIRATVVVGDAAAVPAMANSQTPGPTATSTSTTDGAPPGPDPGSRPNRMHDAIPGAAHEAGSGPDPNAAVSGPPPIDDGIDWWLPLACGGLLLALGALLFARRARSS